MRFSTFMISCDERAAPRAATLASLSASGWSDQPELVLDDGTGSSRIERIHRTWRRLIQRAAAAATDLALLLEDDLVFGTSFAHNVATWPLLREVHARDPFFASLYNPGRPFVVRREAERYLVAHAPGVWGAQALLVTPGTAAFIDAHWHEASGNPDQRMPRLASRVTPIYFHVPSLLDHAPVPTTWGGIEHAAQDFDPAWRAEERSCPV